MSYIICTVKQKPASQEMEVKQDHNFPDKYPTRIAAIRAFYSGLHPEISNASEQFLKNYWQHDWFHTHDLIRIVKA